ncbi:MAG: calcium/sodium antiporter [Caulobacter sp.]|nr:calcium/sodium antiporter [Caulobacter sp.]
MELWMIMAAGLVMLAVGGDLLVRGAASAASRLGVSRLVIGLTVVGFGTSMPELVTSLRAAFGGSPGIAIGNIVGSNISNVLLVLGATALITPLVVDRRAFRRDAAALALATAGLAWALLQGRLTREMGVVGFVLLLVYLLIVWLMERRRPDAEGARIAAAVAGRPGGAGLWLALPMAAVGIGITIYGAHLMVGGAVTLARTLGVSDTVVGLTIVALGTSLPELVTSLVAALRKQGEVALGNVVGSNLYNSLGILGLTAAVRPVDVPPAIAHVDVWVMVAATGLMILLIQRRDQITRGEGLLLLTGYAGYMTWLVLSA